MIKSLLATLVAAVCIGGAAPALAGPYSNDLAKCLGVAIQSLLNREKIACIIALQAC